VHRADLDVALEVYTASERSSLLGQVLGLRVEVVSVTT
jgi:hypothetical protein